MNAPLTHHIHPSLLAFGTPAHIERADCWLLWRIRGDGIERQSIPNEPAWRVELYAALKAGWQLENDDESLAGYTQPSDDTGDSVRSTR